MNEKHPLPIFISYAHEDNLEPHRWLDRLLQYLKLLSNQDLVSVWSDKESKIGSDWNQEIQSNLNKAKAVVLLVSPSFLVSDYIRKSELPVLLTNAKNRGVEILPVIVRHVLWEFARFRYPDPDKGPEEFKLSSLQAANPPDRPLNSMNEADQDKVLLSIAERLIKIVEANLRN